MPSNIKMQAVSLALIILTASCSSVSTLRQNGPLSSYQSKKNVDEVITCISDAWSKKRVQLSVLPIKNGKSIQDVNGLGGSAAGFVDATAENGLTIIKFYSQFGKGKWFDDQVKSCAL